MKVSTERIPESQVVLKIEVDDDQLEKAKASAYRRLSAKARIPGFRPGKAPRNIVEQHLGEHTILHEALDRLLPELYKEALEQEDIDPIDRAEYELVTEQPLVAKFTVPVRPEVELGDYASLRVPREPIVVEPERVQEGLESLRHRYSTVEPVTRPVQWGDVLRADVHAEVDGTQLFKEEDAEFQLVEGRSLSLPGFAEGLIGKEKGAEFSLELTVPEDSQDQRLRGKTAQYRVQLKEVKQEVLPELDDDFARQVGEGFDSLAALRTRVEEDLRAAVEEQARQQYEEKALDALVEQSEMEYPPVLLEREADRLLQEQAGVRSGGQTRRDGAQELERYLQRIGRPEAEVRAELRPIAETRIRRSLVLSRLTEAENIDVTDAGVEGEIERLSTSAGSQSDELRRIFSGDSAKESLRRSLLTRKTLERLVQIASRDGAAEDQPEVEPGPQG